MMIPEKIGRYHIVKELGRGGMATVYHGHDPRFKRDVAIKVLPAQFNHDPTFRVRFQREAETIAALEHPAIVPVYDYGEHEEQPYLVMRLMTGGSLADRLGKGALSVTGCTAVLKRIGSALDRAHNMGVIHRDLKPDNILFDQYDDAYLSDFGIARLAESGATLTGTGVIGTPAYMSPEQIQGQQVDGRTDIYALGIILFEMLTGQKPFDAQTPAMMLVKQMTEPVPRVLDVSPDLPLVYERVIARATAKDVTERYQTVTEMTDTVEARSWSTPSAVPTDFYEPVAQTVAESQPLAATAVSAPPAPTITSPPISPPISPPQPDTQPTLQATKAKKRPLWPYALGGLLLLVVIVVGLIIFLSPEDEFAGGITAEEATDMSILQQFGRGTIQSMALSPDGQNLLIAGSAGIWLYNVADFGLNGQPIQAHQQVVSQVAWSADGQSFVSAGWDGTVRLWDLQNRQQEGLFSYTNQNIALALSPDGQQIASATWEGSIQVWDAASGQRSANLTEHPMDRAYVTHMAWSPDGRWFVSADNVGNVFVWEPTSWQVVQRLTHPEAELGCLAWSPDSERLALCGFYDGVLRVLALADGSEVMALREHGYGVNTAVWSPDGSRLLSGDGEGNVRLWDSSNGRLIRVTATLPNPIVKLIWLPDSNQFLVQDSANTVALWDANGDQLVRELREHTDAIWSLHWSPQNSALAAASGDGTVRIWEPEQEETVAIFKAHEYGLFALDWGPDDRLISVGGDGQIKLWQGANGRLLQTVNSSEVINSLITSLDWTSDGQQLVVGNADGGVSVLSEELDEEFSWSEQSELISTVAWAPHEDWVASVSRDGTILVWDTDDNEEVSKLTGHGDQVTAVAWSPDGEALVSASLDQTARVWDALFGEELLLLRGQDEPMMSVAWSPNGAVIAAGDFAGGVHLWEAETGRPLAVLQGHIAAVISLAWSPDGTRLASASEDGTVLIWGLP